MPDLVADFSANSAGLGAARAATLETQESTHPRFRELFTSDRSPRLVEPKRRAGLQAGTVSRNAGATNIWPKIINQA